MFLHGYFLKIKNIKAMILLKISNKYLGGSEVKVQFTTLNYYY